MFPLRGRKKTVSEPTLEPRDETTCDGLVRDCIIEALPPTAQAALLGEGGGATRPTSIGRGVFLRMLHRLPTDHPMARTAIASSATTLQFEPALATSWQALRALHLLATWRRTGAATRAREQAYAEVFSEPDGFTVGAELARLAPMLPTAGMQVSDWIRSLRVLPHRQTVLTVAHDLAADGMTEPRLQAMWRRVAACRTRAALRASLGLSDTALQAIEDLFSCVSEHLRRPAIRAACSLLESPSQPLDSSLCFDQREVRGIATVLRKEEFSSQADELCSALCILAENPDRERVGPQGVETAAIARLSGLAPEFDSATNKGIAAYLSLPTAFSGDLPVNVYCDAKDRTLAFMSAFARGAHDGLESHTELLRIGLIGRDPQRLAEDIAIALHQVCTHLRRNLAHADADEESRSDLLRWLGAPQTARHLFPALVTSGSGQMLLPRLISSLLRDAEGQTILDMLTAAVEDAPALGSALLRISSNRRTYDPQVHKWMLERLAIVDPTAVIKFRVDVCRYEDTHVSAVDDETISLAIAACRDNAKGSPWVFAHLRQLLISRASKSKFGRVVRHLRPLLDDKVVTMHAEAGDGSFSWAVAAELGQVDDRVRLESEMRSVGVDDGPVAEIVELSACPHLLLRACHSSLLEALTKKNPEGIAEEICSSLRASPEALSEMAEDCIHSLARVLASSALQDLAARETCTTDAASARPGGSATDLVLAAALDEPRTAAPLLRSLGATLASRWFGHRWSVDDTDTNGLDSVSVHHRNQEIFAMVLSLPGAEKVGLLKQVSGRADFLELMRRVGPFLEVCTRERLEALYRHRLPFWRRSRAIPFAEHPHA